MSAAETANLAVSASVAANCTITTAPVAFGGYDPIVTNTSAALDQTGTVSVRCTNGSATTVTLGEGGNFSTTRRMVSGLNFLAYELYSDASREQIWGESAESDVAHTGTGTVTGLTVYGRIPGAQNVPVGTYADTVVATVTF